jgi:hypothetical protein
MLLPKIIFKYSWIYNEHWKEVYNKNKEYPSEKEINSYIKKVEKLWRKDEKKILKELSVISGLRWKEKLIICYVVGKCIPFSDPLTIKTYKEYPPNYFIDVLTHELIHQLFTQSENMRKSKKAWDYFHRKYKNEKFNTIIHIPVHAMHSYIILKYFGEKRLKREIESLSHLPDYKKAWNIVKNEEYKNIIREFNKRVEQ